MKHINRLLTWECQGKLPVLNLQTRLKVLDQDTTTIAWQVVRTHGLLLFRDVGLSWADFGKWTEHITGSQGDVRLAPDSSAGSGPRISLHTEDSMLGAIPAWIWFYSAKPSQIGGETIVCDGTRVVSLLGSTALSILSDKILYRWRTSALGRHFFTSELTDPPGIERGYSGPICREMSYGFDYTATCRPVVRNRMSGNLVFANPILYFDDYYDDGGPPAVDGPLRIRTIDEKSLPRSLLAELRSITSDLSLRIRLEAGELLWIDNTRFLHGREPFEGERSLLVKKAYDKMQCGPVFRQPPGPRS